MKRQVSPVLGVIAVLVVIGVVGLIWWVKSNQDRGQQPSGIQFVKKSKAGK
jgi:hypothetical protein